MEQVPQVHHPCPQVPRHVQQPDPRCRDGRDDQCTAGGRQRQCGRHRGHGCGLDEVKRRRILCRRHEHHECQWPRDDGAHHGRNVGHGDDRDGTRFRGSRRRPVRGSTTAGRPPSSPPTRAQVRRRWLARRSSRRRASLSRMRTTMSSRACPSHSQWSWGAVLARVSWTMTNAAGIATVGSWTLGRTAGTNTLTATSGSLTGSPVTFTAIGTAGPAATIAANGGDGQAAVVGTAVATPPSVIVRDANDNGVEGVPVTFAVSGGGSATGLATTTNAAGIATVGSWTLGVTAGSNTLTATSGSLIGSPVTFTATGTAGPAARVPRHVQQPRPPSPGRT